MNHHLQWVASSKYGSLPPGAVHVGNDSDGSPIYIGRTFHEGEHLPVKVLPSRQEAYIPYGGQEVNVHNYEVLIGHGFTWVSSGNGHAPDGAVVCGHYSNGDPVHIGRAHFNGSVTPGKIQRAHGCLYIPYGGEEHRITAYEVLVAPSPRSSWVRVSGGSVPYNAVVAGRDIDGSPLYVGRAFHEGEMVPAKVTHDRAYVAYGGREHSKYEYEVLVGGRHSWIHSGHGAPVPHNAVSTGRTTSHEPLYVGRALHMGNHMPGKIHLSHGSLYLPFGGEEIALRDYEVLIEH